MLCVHLQEGPLDIKSMALVVFFTHDRKVKYIMRWFKYLRFLGSLKFRSGYGFKWNFSSGGKCSDSFFPWSFLIFMQLCSWIKPDSETEMPIRNHLLLRFLPCFYGPAESPWLIMPPNTSLQAVATGSGRFSKHIKLHFSLFSMTMCFLFAL